MMLKVAWLGLEGGHARANPREEECGLGWTSQGKPPGRRNQAGSAWSGFGGGHAKPDPREEEIRLEVRGLEVDISEQTPGKKK